MKITVLGIKHDDVSEKKKPLAKVGNVLYFNDDLQDN